jgi:hypothetical protein
MLVLAALIIALWPDHRRISVSAEGPAPAWRLKRQTYAWLAVTAAVGLFPINVHTWYTIWVIVPLAIVWSLKARSRWNVWILPVLAMLFLTFLVYHTWPIVIHHKSTTSASTMQLIDAALARTRDGIHG